MITADERRDRRRKLAEAISRPIVLTAHTATQSTADMAAPFRQDASFFYYAGITAADWKLLFDGHDWVLVAPVVSAGHELFDGSLSAEDAMTISGITTVLNETDYHKRLTKIAETYQSVATLGRPGYAKYVGFVMNPAQAKLRRRLKISFKELYDCRPAINRQRAIKSDGEITELQAAVDVTSAGFQTVYRRLADYRHEYEIEADLQQAFRRQGSGGQAYEPIVAAGGNACTLHYTANRSALKAGQIVLIDAATSVDGYAADLTRSYAVGEVSERYRQVHRAVVDAQQNIIALIKPGLAIKDYLNDVDRIMKRVVTDLGFAETDYRRLFPHAISHGLGLDVHESLGGFDTFQPGVVLTVEPGIYIPEEAVGIRIEDDILVTGTGNRNLSTALANGL